MNINVFYAQIVTEYNYKHIDTSIIHKNADKSNLPKWKDSKIRMPGTGITCTSNLLVERLVKYYYQW